MIPEIFAYIGEEQAASIPTSLELDVEIHNAIYKLMNKFQQENVRAAAA